MPIEPRDLVTAGIPITAENMLLFHVVWPIFEREVKRFARRLTKDKDAREDLIQEAMITLWKCDPARYDFLKVSDEAFVHRMLINRMRDVFGRVRNRDTRDVQYESVDTMPATHVRALVAQLREL